MNSNTKTIQPQKFYVRQTLNGKWNSFLRRLEALVTKCFFFNNPETQNKNNVFSFFFLHCVRQIFGNDTFRACRYRA